MLSRRQDAAQAKQANGIESGRRWEVGTAIALVCSEAHKRRMSVKTGKITLTVAGARKLLKCNYGRISLKNLTHLSVKVAEVLASRDESYRLDGLTELSAGAAAALAKRRGDRSLNGLTSLSVETAKGLAQFDGFLSLNGLSTLPDAVAEALAKFSGTSLDLDGLVSISRRGLVSLASSKGKRLSLGLTCITAEQAKILEAHKGELKLFIRRLPTEVAAILGKRKGKLDLPSLSSVSVEAARVLAKHRGDLEMNGLKQLSAGVARQLAKHKGYIGLGGLKQISRDAVRALAKVEGEIGSRGLESISMGMAAEMAKRPGWLDLTGLKYLSDGVAKVFAKRREMLGLYGIMNLTDRQVEILLPKYASGTLNFADRGRTHVKMENAWKKARIDGRWPFRRQ